MRTRRTLGLLLLVGLAACSKSSGGDTTIINQDLVPADPPLKAWRIPEAVTINNAGSSQRGEVRFDAAGNALALLVQNGIWARRWTPDQGWEPIERVSDPASPYGTEPKLAMDSAGNAIAIFSQLDDPSALFYSVWWNRYTPGVGWETAQLLETDDVLSATGGEIAMDPAGNALVIWSASDGFQTDLMFSRYLSGLDWTTPAPLDDGPESAGSPKVGMDAAGNAIAIWSRFDGDSEIVTSRYVSGVWTAIEPLELSVETPFSPELAVNASGRAMAVWIQFDGVSPVDLWSRVYDPATGWGTPILVETISDDVSFHQVVLDASGTATVVWTTYQNEFWYARNAPGAGWTSAESVAPLMNALSPRLAVNASGTVGAIWQHDDGLVSNILFATHSGASWSPPEFVEFHEEYSQDPVLAMDTNGNAVALWTVYDDVVGFRTWGNWYR
jgi:hypothetical protein